MPTTKISVTIDDIELEWLKRRAKRVHAGNLSAAIVEAARAIRKQEALKSFLEATGAPVLTPEEVDTIRAEWSAPVPRPAARAPRKKRVG